MVIDKLFEMGREVESVNKDAANGKVHVASKIAADEDYEVKECTEEDSLSQNHRSPPNVSTEVLYSSP